jgi:prevent-host-death family protein
MTRIGLFEAKQKLSELVQRAASGEEIVITRHGQPAAVLRGVRGAEDAARAREAGRRIAARRKRLKPVSRAEIRRWIAEGRR